MNEEVKTRFETSGEITTELITAFAKQSILASVRRKMIWFAILLLDMLLLIWLKSDGAVWAAMLIIALAIAYFFGYRKALKNTIDRFLEQASSGVIEYRIAFSDDSLHIHNLATSGKSLIALKNMQRVVQINEVWILVTKTSMYTPVFASELSETDQKSLLALLKQNNPKIKIQLPKK